MGASDESFLPQIVGLFYATFDPRLGPVVLHQVPENLITSSAGDRDESQSQSQCQSRSRSRSRSQSHSHSHSNRESRRPSHSHSRTRRRSRSRSHSAHANRHDAPTSSSSSSSASEPECMLDFGPISEYIIPKKSLQGKLVSLLTMGMTEDGDPQEYRVIGFPAALTDTGESGNAGLGGRYSRNEYIWNLCFVFKVVSSLDAFEPVVRKCARILRSAEIDSAYLSSPAPEHTPLNAVLEQLFEDLNSYSETSIPLDGFNSLELKLFPFYPNPPECEDWHVPIALVDLNALKDDNWDITAARVSQFIDGVNHVARIAQLANADLALTRETLKHMLFYQVIMMIDIFQFSNMYTLRPSITHLASDPTIIAECGHYVTLPSHSSPSWPVLLDLYSHLQPGITVHQWLETNKVSDLGVDPRRFVSFGIIKGFLRRVHRWPILLDREKATGSPFLGHGEHRRRVEFDKSTRAGTNTKLGSSVNLREYGKGTESAFTLRSTTSNGSLGLGISPGSLVPGRTPPSALSKSPGTRSALKSGTMLSTITSTTVSESGQNPKSATGTATGAYGRSHASAETHGSSKFTRAGMKAGALRVREDAVDAGLLSYLDGRHHADEIQVRFKMGWKQLEKVLGLEDIAEGKEGKGKKGITVVYR